MNEMITKVSEDKYEITFTTDNMQNFDAVQNECRKCIDKKPLNFDFIYDKSKQGFKSESSNNSCEGCQTYERVKKGETVIGDDCYWCCKNLSATIGITTSYTTARQCQICQEPTESIDNFLCRECKRRLADLLYAPKDYTK